MSVFSPSYANPKYDVSVLSPSYVSVLSPIYANPKYDLYVYSPS